MKAMKWIGLAVLLAVGVTLFASTPAWAGGMGPSWNWGTIELQAADTTDEPQASGLATLTHVTRWGDAAFYSGKLTVKCQNLTPGATYSTPAGTFKATRKGDGGVVGQVSFEWDGYWWAPWVVDVFRLDAGGSSTKVLTGGFLPPGY